MLSESVLPLAPAPPSQDPFAQVGTHPSFLFAGASPALTYRLRCLGWVPSPQQAASRSAPQEGKGREEGGISVILSGVLFQVTSGTEEKTRCFIHPYPRRT